MLVMAIIRVRIPQRWGRTPCGRSKIDRPTKRRGPCTCSYRNFIGQEQHAMGVKCCCKPEPRIENLDSLPPKRDIMNTPGA